MGLKREVKRLKEAAKAHLTVLRLKDGTTAEVHPGELLSAVAACVRQRDHRLLPLVRRADPRSHGRVGLIQALEESRRLAEKDREDGV